MSITERRVHITLNREQARVNSLKPERRARQLAPFVKASLVARPARARGVAAAARRYRRQVTLIGLFSICLCRTTSFPDNLWRGRIDDAIFLAVLAFLGGRVDKRTPALRDLLGCLRRLVVRRLRFNPSCDHKLDGIDQVLRTGGASRRIATERSVNVVRPGSRAKQRKTEIYLRFARRRSRRPVDADISRNFWRLSSAGVMKRFAPGRSENAGRIESREKNGRELMLRLSNSAMIANLSRPKLGSSTVVTIQ